MDTTYPRPLLQSLGAAADAVSIEELAAAVFLCVIGTVGVDNALVAHLDQAAPPVASWTWPDGFLSHEEANRFERLHRDDPWILATHTRLRDGSPLRISDRLTRHQFRRLPIYSELFRPLEIDHQVAFSLPGGPSRSMCVAVSRSRRDFSDHELEQFEMLRRPLAAIIAQVFSRFVTPDERHSERRGELSDREGAVLALVAEGHANGQIGRRLGISVRTVEKHLEHVYAKTGARNRTDAAIWWLDARPSPSERSGPARDAVRPWDKRPITAVRRAAAT